VIAGRADELHFVVVASSDDALSGHDYVLGAVALDTTALVVKGIGLQPRRIHAGLE